MNNHSCIYEGVVVHRRSEPIARVFKYRLCMMYVDLDELPRLFDRRWLWSSSCLNVAWFRRADYLGAPEESLDDSVRNLVAERTGHRPQGPIRVLTHFRYFGYIFNPLTLYYCFDEHDGVEAIVAEVSNTPWGERFCYVLQPSQDDRSAVSLEFNAAKQIHVSPFLTMDYDYAFRLSQPGAKLNVQIANWPQSGSEVRPTFVADLSMQRRELTGANLCRVLVRYPLMTQRVIAAIYWQALQLWWQKVPFVPHPAASTNASLSAGRPNKTLAMQSVEANYE